MRRFTIGILAGTLATAAAADGPVSEYFLTDNVGRNIFVVKDNNLSRVWPTPDYECALAVSDTVKTIGARNGENGREYDHDGNQTGKIYPNTFGTFYDGATDGVHMYAIEYATKDVIQFDSNWSNPKVLFNHGARTYYLGITYDPQTKSLWIAEYNGDRVENRSLDGTLLSSFKTGTNYAAALALDPAEGSLWLAAYGGGGWLSQFDKNGNRLSTVFCPDLVGVFPFGGEFMIRKPTIKTLPADQKTPDLQ